MNAVAKTIKVLSLLVAALLVAAMAGCQYILPKEEKLQAPPLVEPKDVIYSTVEVKKGSIVDSVTGTGKFQSVYREDVYYTASGGRIKKINVKIGDMVKKGDVLMELTNDDLAMNLKIAELRMEQQKLNFEQNKRYLRKAQLRNAEIDLEIAQIQLDQLRKQMEDSLLRAPIDGQVTYITTASQGSWVDSYATLVKIEDQATKMLTYVNEQNRAMFQIGSKVNVTLKDGTTTEGVVVSAPFDRDKVNKEDLDKMLFIKVPDDIMAKTLVGDEARLQLIVAQADNVLVLPKNVVKIFGNRRYVGVLENGIKVEKDVEIGIESSTEAEIVSGLTEGEKVIR